jgi:hypothetical protein
VVVEESIDWLDVLATLTKERRQGINKITIFDRLKYAQYFTLQAVADFMVEMFADRPDAQALVLDPGVGKRILGKSLFARLVRNGVHAFQRCPSRTGLRARAAVAQSAGAVPAGYVQFIA